MRVREHAGSIGEGVAGRNGPLRRVAQDAARGQSQGGAILPQGDFD